MEVNTFMTDLIVRNNRSTKEEDLNNERFLMALKTTNTMLYQEIKVDYH